MFEQSILVQKRTTKPWSVLLSLAAELAGIGLLILAPLVWADKLPLFGLTKIGVWLAQKPPERPPIQQVQPQPRTKPSPFREGRLIAPTSIPPRANQISDDWTAAPDLPQGLPTGDNRNIGLPTSLLTRNVERIPEPPAVQTPPPAQHAAPIRISHVDPAQILYKPMPVYPDLAKRTHTQGVVKLVGVIGTDGTIQNLRAVSGHALLIQAALDAVSKWRFRPVILNGQPVAVEAPIDVTFTLQ